MLILKIKLLELTLRQFSELKFAFSTLSISIRYLLMPHHFTATLQDFKTFRYQILNERQQCKRLQKKLIKFKLQKNIISKKYVRKCGINRTDFK